MSEHNPDKRKPVNYDELFPGRFLKAGLIKGRTMFTIAAVDTEKMPDKPGKPDKTQGIITFKEIELQWTLNKTNGQCLRAMFGTQIQADWIGKRVVLQQEKDRFGRDIVDSIRIYGSPDITEDISITIDLGRRGTVQRVLKAPKKTREPGQEG